MSVNRLSGLVARQELAAKFEPAAEVLDTVMTCPAVQMMVEQGLADHPGSQCTLVVLDMGLEISRDLVGHMKPSAGQAAEIAEQQQFWRSAGMPDLYVFVGDSRMGATVVEFCAKNEPQALEGFNKLRHFPAVAFCVAGGQSVMMPLQPKSPADAERARRQQRARSRST